MIKEKLSSLKEKYIFDEPDYRVIKRINRKKNELFYTQGFAFLNDTTLIESAGLYGESELHLIDLTNDEIHISISNKLDKKYFAEGSDFYINLKGESEIHQLTWMEKKILIYDSDNLKLKRIVNIPNEFSAGWGLTSFKENNKFKFYATDGTDRIFKINPENWNIEKIIYVKDFQNNSIKNLNDLEVINGNIFLNVYLTTDIIEVDNQGKLIRKFDFKRLKDEVFNTKIFKDANFDNQNCLNGIAYNEKNKKLLITGKKWPYIYQVEFKDRKN